MKKIRLLPVSIFCVLTVLLPFPLSGEEKIILDSDDLGRLTYASTTGYSAAPFKRTYEYDSIGNIVYKSDQGKYRYEGSSSNSYTNPYAVTQIGSTTPTYDKNGNMTSFGDKEYKWDYRNRLIEAVIDGVTTTFGYDHNDQRVSKSNENTMTHYSFPHYEKTGATTTSYIYSDGKLVTAIVNDGVSTSTYHIHTDHLGSVIAVTNEEGHLVQEISYYPFGEIRINKRYTSFDISRKFTGLEYDEETGLYYAGKRYYDPSIGKWLSQDPVALFWGVPRQLEEEIGITQEQLLSNPQIHNTYTYGLNNPIVYIDPTGEAAYYFDNGGGMTGKDWKDTNTYTESGDRAILINNVQSVSDGGFLDKARFTNNVRQWGVWDYKHERHKRGYYIYQGKVVSDDEFGNINYGATGAAAGFSRETLNTAGALVNSVSKLEFEEPPEDIRDTSTGYDAYTSGQLSEHSTHGPHQNYTEHSTDGMYINRLINLLEELVIALQDQYEEHRN